MIRRSTVVYIIVLLVVLGAFFYLRNRNQPEDTVATPESTAEVSFLFAPDQGAPTSILIQAKTGETVGLARNTENAWALTRPVIAAAEQSASEAAAGQITTMRILEMIPKIDLGLVGLKDPAYIMTVKFNNATERTVHIGVVTPTGSGYYVQDATGGDVLIVTKSSIDALLELLTAPPYAETPTPAQAGTTPYP